MLLEVRPIQPADDDAICHVIKSVFEEHGINRPGTAYFDESLNCMSTAFDVDKAAYFVGLVDDVIVGGAGIYPTAGLPPGTCELVKMYLLPQTRGLGLGRLLIEKCMHFARLQGYTQIYLETMPELKKAVSIYEKLGFSSLTSPLGNTGHYSCSIYMLKHL
jgi:putative acetyltransferase